jgi:hypothetical protein
MDTDAVAAHRGSVVADTEQDISRLLVSVGVALMYPGAVNTAIGASDQSWREFAAHWDELGEDPYAAELGTRRRRRYGHVLFRDGTLTPRPHDSFVQPGNSNPLYVGRERHFQPLTDAFTTDGLLGALLNMLARAATVLEERAEFSVKITPFRVEATAEFPGHPAPEGVHRDGVTLVSTLLVSRRNAVGGQTSVFDMKGNRVVKTTLSQPGALLIADDRATLHAVSPIYPADPRQPATRDVLVITFAPPSTR